MSRLSTLASHGLASLLSLTWKLSVLHFASFLVMHTWHPDRVAHAMGRKSVRCSTLTTDVMRASKAEQAWHTDPRTRFQQTLTLTVSLRYDVVEDALPWQKVEDHREVEAHLEGVHQHQEIEDNYERVVRDPSFFVHVHPTKVSTLFHYRCRQD
ncbi:hypothetical protein Scep_001889 [Stephania cephalantha]|uniref:Uncharacterized protein n=1 Tax=Stephania cephalantha TaxID=152367 RepID=A0AAP0LA77_9MAGN